MTVTSDRNDNIYSPNLNGYRCSHKNKWLFIKYGILSIQELALLEFYADIVDFDKNHTDFGLLKVDFKSIKTIFKCKSENTVRNWHNRLIELGFIISTNQRNILKLTCCERYISPGIWKGKASDYAKSEKNQPIEIILQNFGIDLQSIEKRLQPVVNIKDKNLKKQSSIAIVSSKDDSSIFPKKVIIKQDLRNKEEYQKIYKEGDFISLIPDDMKWIDENVFEELHNN